MNEEREVFLKSQKSDVRSGSNPSPRSSGGTRSGACAAGAAQQGGVSACRGVRAPLRLAALCASPRKREDGRRNPLRLAALGASPRKREDGRRNPLRLAALGASPRSAGGRVISIAVIGHWLPDEGGTCLDIPQRCVHAAEADEFVMGSHLGD